MKLEHISLFQLIAAYVTEHYPSDTVVVIDLFQSDDPVILREEIAELGVVLPPSFIIPGYVIASTTPEVALALTVKYDKTGVDIWTFINGFCVNESR